MIQKAADRDSWSARVLGWSALLGAALLLPAAPGCLFTLIGGDCGLILTIQGQLLDADGTTPVSGAIVGGRIFFPDGQTDYVSLFAFDGTQNAPSSIEDGSFQVEFATLGPCPPGVRPSPDRVEVLVRGDTCETTYTIDVNDSTVIDQGTTYAPGSSTHTLELKDPILVPACDGGTQP